MGKKIEAVDCASEKHTSKHFKKSLETYKLLFESSGIPICVFDINGTIILYNQAAIKIIGGTAKEYVGKSLIGIFGDNFGREYIKRILLTAESEVSLQFEDFVQLPTGNHWFLSNFTSIQNSEGIVIGIQVVWQNITEHKQKIDAISKNEEKFQALFSALTDVIIEIDSDGRLVEVLSLNPSLHSESYGELVGKTLHEIFPKAQADFILNNVKRTLEKREAVDINHSLKINENELIFEGKLSPLKSNSVLLVEREVTEHIKAEEAVRLANLYNRSLIEASLDPLVTVGPDGKITDVNKATELVTGYSHKELIGDDFSNYFTDPKKAGFGYQKVLADGLVRDYPLSIKHVSGKTTDVLYNASVYRNEKGEIQGVFAAARDITMSKMAEEALRESEEKYRKLVEQSPDAVLIHVDGIIQFVNKSSVRLFEALSKEELIGKKIIDLVHHDFKQIVKQRIREIIEEEANVPTIEEKLISLKG
ncbi:MAG: PAS domain-containing protein, partial [Ignavibacteria bacterium]|nr:PAS domain-containing protein [Ignavibacteria bacterium]